MLADRLRALPLARRYEVLSARERRLVNLGAVVVAAAIGYLGVVSPALAFHDDALARYRQQESQLEWMRLHAGQARRQESTAGQPVRNQSLLTLIDRTAQEFDLRLASYRSESGGGGERGRAAAGLRRDPALDAEACLRARHPGDPGVHRRAGRGARQRSVRPTLAPSTAGTRRIRNSVLASTAARE